MPRALRVQTAGFVHHVISRGNDKQVLFRTSDDFKEYLSLIKEAKHFYSLKIYNFCLMSNHIHLLVEPKEDGALSKVMEDVTKGYAKYFNRKYDHTGHVFEGRFKSFLIQEERYFIACSRYIDLNPKKAHLVKDPKEYKWSAYKYLAHGSEVPLKIEQHGIYHELGKNDVERRIVYKALVTSSQADELNLLERRAGILGDKVFKNDVKKKAKYAK